MKMIPKINLSFSVAALALFLLPWIDIQCSDRSFVTQTGLQSIYGGASISKEFEVFANEMNADVADVDADKSKESIGIAWFAALALMIVIGATVMSFLAFRYPNKYSQNTAGLLCLLALLLVILQMVVGFPVHREISDAMAEAVNDGVDDYPFGAMGAGMKAAMIQVRFLPWIYLEIVALAIPASLFLNQVLDKIKKE